ncbi:hypothetical protein ACH4U6_31740 [Streptomyces netropsis]|uniref:hypothetical protein n=1 Tax=Streptomyces netropsis TaxID=55404 RepID=UPI00379B874E
MTTEGDVVDLAQLAERSVAVTGDFLLASATGAATQVGSAVSQLVIGRLGISPHSSGASQELQAAPDDAQRRADASDALRELLHQEPEFAEQLAHELQKMQQRIRVEPHGQNNRTFVNSPLTAHGKGKVIGGDSNKSITKKSGALWGLLAAVVVALGGGATVLLTQSGQDDSPERQAEKVAVDFLRATYRGDMETVCGLASKGAANGTGSLSLCRDDKKLTEMKNRPVPEDQLEFAKQWKATTVDLPSDNTARVTAVNAGKGVIVHLTREEGSWRVVDTKGGQ